MLINLSPRIRSKLHLEFVLIGVSCCTVLLKKRRSLSRNWTDVQRTLSECNVNVNVVLRKEFK